MNADFQKQFTELAFRMKKLAGSVDDLSLKVEDTQAARIAYDAIASSLAGLEKSVNNLEVLTDRARRHNDIKALIEDAKGNAELTAAAINRCPDLALQNVLNINDCHDFSIVSLCLEFPALVSKVDQSFLGNAHTWSKSLLRNWERACSRYNSSITVTQFMTVQNIPEEGNQ